MVRILDSTLREGEQTPGVYFPPHFKMAIATHLDALGVEIIEVGHPAVTPEIAGSVRRIAAAGLNSTIGAHARSLLSDVDQALACQVGFLGIFYCVTNERLRLHTRSLNEAVNQVQQVIRHVREQAPHMVIRYTPEDTVRSPWANVVRAAVSAAEAGAHVISIADTTGHMVPGTERSLYDYAMRLREALDSAGLHPELAVHCHNDRGLAMANALDAIRAGVDIIDCSVLGLGERAGIVDLATLLTVLAADFEHTRHDLFGLPDLYQLVSRHASVPIPVHQPVTGINAFRHCAGVHTQAALVDPLHYQSLDPFLVNRAPSICLDHMSGMSALRHALDGIESTTNEPQLEQDILAMVKNVGQSGRIVDDTELRHIVRYCREAQAITEAREQESC